MIPQGMPALQEEGGTGLMGGMAFGRGMMGMTRRGGRMGGMGPTGDGMDRMMERRLNMPRRVGTLRARAAMGGEFPRRPGDPPWEVKKQRAHDLLMQRMEIRARGGIPPPIGVERGPWRRQPGQFNGGMGM